MKNKTLLILAAGAGSRFGGLKQIEPLGPNGEFIIDYSVYDAIKAGFNKIVFLIKEENYDVFKETIGKRVEPHINVAYCFQKNDNIPTGYKVPEDRTKPLGTAHAILCCKDEIHEPFAIINSDDFYGKDAYLKAAEFLDKTEDQLPHKYGLINYLVKNTITESGSVKRGVCKVESGMLTKITESLIERKNGNLIATPLSGEKEFIISPDDKVSMNLILFTPSVFPYIESKFPEFFEKNKDNLEKCEYLIPDVLFSAIEENYATVNAIDTNSTWYGVTYKEDAQSVRKALKELVDKKEYPSNLWEKK